MSAQLDIQFQRILGRAPTSDELSYFQKFIDAGELQNEEIGQILQSTPEFQQAQLQKNTADFGQRLQANDQQILQQGSDIAGAQATSRFAGLGRPNSSALAASVFGQTGKLASSLAQNRQSALADFYGRGLQQNAALGAQQGQNSLNRGYGLRDETRRRGYEIEDYYRQKNDAASYENAHSGWNAITPEFVASGLFSVGGKAASSYAGGYAGAAGKKAGGGV